MRYLTVFLIAIFWNFSLHAQTYELGGYVGGSNSISDVGSTSFIAPSKLALGGIFKWNRSVRHSFRFTAIFTELEGKDSESDESRRQSRGYSFTNSIKELSLGLEYTFVDFDLFKDRNPSTPYLYTGFTYFNHDELFLDGNILRKDGSSWDVAIPMVLGYKLAFNSNMIIALEAGARYTLTDNLDGSNPGNDGGVRSFGNINNDDWYMFTGVTVSFAFGRRPCYCGF